jgi:hypothetical protein
MLTKPSKWYPKHSKYYQIPKSELRTTGMAQTQKTVPLEWHLAEVSLQVHSVVVVVHSKAR